MKDNRIFDKLSRGLIIAAVLIVLFSLFAPIIFTRSGMFDFSTTGNIGDTIGGIMNPFIAIASAIVMFLAFYMQYNANKMMQSQFEKNQFDSQFFEMLKTHKDNSNVIINTSFESYEGKGFGCEEAHREWLDNRKTGFEFLVEQINLKYDELKGKTTQEDSKIIFNKAYKNIWKDSYGHYFRHLFLTVRLVVSKPESFLTYEEKRNYLRILRASLSTYEQIFLYYNWLSDYGSQWENKNNHFFTDYRMIHNVSDAIHDDFAIETTLPFVGLLNDGNYRKEKDRLDDKLFELFGK